MIIRGVCMSMGVTSITTDPDDLILHMDHNSTVENGIYSIKAYLGFLVSFPIIVSANADILLSCA